MENKSGGALLNGGLLNNRGAFANQMSATLNVAQQAKFDNAATATLSNLGTLENHGTFDNSGIIVNDTLAEGGSGVLMNSGTLTNKNTGVLKNYGSLSNTGVFKNFGSVLNTGTLDNDHTEIFNYGSISNTGTLNNHRFAYLRVFGGLTNSGTLNNSGLIGNYNALTNSGTLNNALTGQLHNYGSFPNTGVVSNAGSIISNGSLTNTGTFTVTTTGTVSGTCLVVQTAGMMEVDGSLSQTAIAISGGVLKGKGTIDGQLELSGTGQLQPGDSPGTLTLQGPFRMSGGTLGIEIEGQAPGEFDVLNIEGAANFTGGQIVFDFTHYTQPLPSTVSYQFLDLGGGGTNLDAMTFGFLGLAPGFTFAIYPSGTLQRENLHSSSSVPLPPALWLLGAPLAALMSGRRRRRAVQGGGRAH